MTEAPRPRRHTGGCLCGALRYEAVEQPTSMGNCYCNDCQRVSGSGFVPFMSFDAGGLTITGPARQLITSAARGGTATRNFCSMCGSLVFGGELGRSDSFTIYAGTLDDRSGFEPQMAIFGSNRPPWVPLPATITRVFARMPGDEDSDGGAAG